MATSHLAPPIPLLSEMDKPYKPTELDKRSLGMKRRHTNEHHKKHRRDRRRNRDCASDDYAIGITHSWLKGNEVMGSMSRSLLNLRRAAELSDKISNQGTTWSRRNLQEQPGRWTVSSKAGSTRGWTTLNPTFRHCVQNSASYNQPSPAVITLRRASSRPSARKDQLTFFPPPTFSHARSGLVSNFLSTMSGRMGTNRTTEDLDFFAEAVQPRTRMASIAGNAAIPAVSRVGELTVTETSVEPVLSLVDYNETLHPRRCSTRFVSGTSVYEVLWDENDTPSDHSTPSPLLLNIPPQSERRQSAAVVELEKQLMSTTARSRQSSWLASSMHSDGQYFRPGREGSFQGLLNFKLSRLINEAALQNLPRSRQKKARRQDSTITATGSPIYHTIEDIDQNAVKMNPDRLPSLRSRVMSIADLAVHDDPVAATRAKDHTGSMIGASSHVRRQKAAQPAASKGWTRATSSHGAFSGFKTGYRLGDGDSVPLINPIDDEERDPWS